MCASAARQLVVNADDFGLTPGINAGIVDAHRRGIVTSASLFANAPDTEGAIRIARRTPALGVGCHLALVDGIPVLPPWQVPTLAPGGRFRPTWKAFIAAALLRRFDWREVERELDAQIERLRSAGVALTHLDAHKHVHAYPPVFEIVARLARKAGVRRVRVPFERPAPTLTARHAGAAGRRRQAIENLALAPWARRDRAILARHRLDAPPAFFGRVLTGHMRTADIISIVDGLPPGTSELMAHPGYVDESLSRVRTRLRAERETEVGALTDRATRDAVSRAGVVLVRHDGRPCFVESYSHASAR